MERHTKHRILGLLVIVGLIIILLPFFQGGESSESALVEAPPFPDQATQVSVADSTKLASSESKAISDVKSQEMTTENTANTEPLSGSVDDGIKPLTETKNTNDRPDEAIDLNQKPNTANIQEPSMTTSDENTPHNVVTNESTEIKPVSTNEEGVAATVDDQSKTSESEPVKEDLKVKTKLKKQKELAKTHPKKHPLQKLSQSPALKAGQIISYASLIGADETGTNHARVKQALTISSKTFAVQVGTFKNKANALRLVNKLRTRGYKSFIQEASLPSGSKSTRVLVGPEKNHAVARSLATQIKNEFDVQGVVVGYKPLAM